MRRALKVFFIFACLFAQMSSLTGEEITPHKNKKVLRAHYNKLLDASYQYLNFINQITSGKTVHPYEDGKKLFTEDLQKIVNAQVFFSNRDDLISALLTGYEINGPSEVNPADIIVSPSSFNVVLRLMVKQNNQTYTSIAILSYDQDYLITEINEVFSRVAFSPPSLSKA